MGRKESKQTNKMTYGLRIGAVRGCQKQTLVVSTRVVFNNSEFFLDTFLARVSFSCLLITFANSLDPDLDRHNVGPELDPKVDTLKVFLKEFTERVSR